MIEMKSTFSECHPIMSRFVVCVNLDGLNMAKVQVYLEINQTQLTIKFIVRERGVSGTRG